MRSGVKRILSVVAAYAVALHAVLWVAAAPFAPASAVAPLAVICHSEAGAPADQAPDYGPDHGPLAPAHASNHCNLCSAIAPPAPYAVVAGQLAPMRTLDLLRPIGLARREDATADPKLARGPPAIA